MNYHYLFLKKCSLKTKDQKEVQWLSEKNTCSTYNLSLIQILDLTTEELIADIIEHEKKYFGIDLKKALESDEARETEVKKLYDILREIRKSMSNTEVTIAKSMGLLDSKGRSFKSNTKIKFNLLSEKSLFPPLPFEFFYPLHFSLSYLCTS